MYIIFLVILAIIFILVPIIDAYGLLDEKVDDKDSQEDAKKEEKKEVTEKMKCKGYYVTIAFIWGMTVPVIIMCIIGGISLSDIGFRLMTFNQNIWFTVITIILAFVLLCKEFVIPLVRIKKVREKILNDDEEDINEYPQTSKEKWIYFIQILSFAICEEIVYRGFLLFLLYAIFPEIPIFLICLIAFVAFGIGHLYQGLRSAIEIGFFGVLSMCLLIVTGSLVPSILLHLFCEFISIIIINKANDNNITTV